VTYQQFIEIAWLVIALIGWQRSFRLMLHSRRVVQAVRRNGAALIYARGAWVQEAVRLLAFSGFIIAVPIGRIFPGRGAVLALFLGLGCLVTNTYLSGRLTARLEAENGS
jgi:hypothetical protein